MNNLRQSSLILPASFDSLRRRVGVVLAITFLTQLPDCSPNTGSVHDNGSNGQCTTGERATDFASCTSDDQCYSGYCCIAGVLGCGRQGNYPGYCVHPNTSAYNAGHGYSCKTDADCDAVASDFVAHGGYGHCYKDNVNDVSNGCGFNCTAPTAPTPTTGAGGTASIGGGSPGAGGTVSSGQSSGGG